MHIHPKMDEAVEMLGFDTENKVENPNIQKRC